MTDLRSRANQRDTQATVMSVGIGLSSGGRQAAQRCATRGEGIGLDAELLEHRDVQIRERVGVCHSGGGQGTARDRLLFGRASQERSAMLLDLRLQRWWASFSADCMFFSRASIAGRNIPRSIACARDYTRVCLLACPTACLPIHFRFKSRATTSRLTSVKGYVVLGCLLIHLFTWR